MAETNRPTQLDQPKTKPFRYLDLPAELQLRILELAVTESEVIDVSDKDREEKTQLAITRVSAGIRADALPFYYSLNKFKASYCNDRIEKTGAWLNGMGAASRGKIRDLVLYDKGFERDGGDDVCIEPARQWLSQLVAEVVKNAEGRYDVTFPAM